MMRCLLLFLLLLPFSLYADRLNYKKSYSTPVAVKQIQSDKIKLYLGTPILINEFKKSGGKEIRARPQYIKTWLLTHEHFDDSVHNGNVLKFSLILDIDHDDIKMLTVRDQNVINSERTSPDIPKMTKFFVNALTGTLNNNMQIRITLPLFLKSKDGVKFMKLKVLIKTVKNKIFYNTFKFTYYSHR